MILRSNVVVTQSPFASLLEMCDFIIGFEGEIPGAAPEQCGNYQEQNLDMAKYYIKKYKDALVNDRHLVYPE